MLGNLKNISDRLNQREAEQEFKLKMIDADLLAPCAKNIYGIREIEELAQDIKENGLYHNLVVRPIADDMYEILSGERRFRALSSLGYKKIPCQVREDLIDKDIDAEILLIQANAKTRELTHIEKIKQIERLEDLYKEKRGNGEKLQGKTRDLIGKDVGLSGAQVGRYQKLGKNLIGGLKELLDKDKLTLNQADILASLDGTEQAIMYDQIKTLGKEETKIIVEGIKQQVDLPKARAEELINEKDTFKKQDVQEKTIRSQEVTNEKTNNVNITNSKKNDNQSLKKSINTPTKEDEEEKTEYSLEQILEENKITLITYTDVHSKLRIRLTQVKDIKIENSGAGDSKNITICSGTEAVFLIVVNDTTCIRQSEYMYELVEKKLSIGIRCS